MSSHRWCDENGRSDTVPKVPFSSLGDRSSCDLEAISDLKLYCIPQILESKCSKPETSLEYI